MKKKKITLEEMVKKSVAVRREKDGFRALAAQARMAANKRWEEYYKTHPRPNTPNNDSV